MSGRAKSRESEREKDGCDRQSETDKMRTWNHYHVNANSIDSTSREMAKAIILIVNNFE